MGQIKRHYLLVLLVQTATTDKYVTNKFNLLNAGSTLQ